MPKTPWDTEDVIPLSAFRLGIVTTEDIKWASNLTKPKLTIVKVHTPEGDAWEHGWQYIMDSAEWQRHMRLTDDEKRVIDRIHERADNEGVRHFGSASLSHIDLVILSTFLKKLDVTNDNG